MSKQLLNNYYNTLEETIRYGGSRNEGSVSIPFFNLVNAYAEKRNLRLVHQRDINGLHGKKVRPDGVVTNALNLEFGIWESKDEKDTSSKTATRAGGCFACVAAFRCGRKVSG